MPPLYHLPTCRVSTRGANLVGEVEQDKESYRLCYVRGPEGIIVALPSSSADAFEAGQNPTADLRG